MCCRAQAFGMDTTIRHIRLTFEMHKCESHSATFHQSHFRGIQMHNCTCTYPEHPWYWDFTNKFYVLVSTVHYLWKRDTVRLYYGFGYGYGIIRDKMANIYLVDCHRCYSYHQLYSHFKSSNLVKYGCDYHLTILSAVFHLFLSIFYSCHFTQSQSQLEPWEIVSSIESKKRRKQMILFFRNDLKCMSYNVLQTVSSRHRHRHTYDWQQN